MQLRPVSYQWKETHAADVGFVAEEVAKLDERLVTRFDLINHLRKKFT